MKKEKGNPKTRDVSRQAHTCRDKLVNIQDAHLLTCCDKQLLPQACPLSSLLRQARVMLHLLPPYVCGLGLLYTNYIYIYYVCGFSVCEMMRSL